MSKVLVISGHPDLDASYTNQVILDQLEAELDNIAVRRLDALYPDYQIDVPAEQQAMLDADVIVLQFPFYWYSVPALLKKWIDEAFSFNFAYGPEGDKLKGKAFILSFTVGGPQDSYDPLGYNHFTIDQLIRPLQQTAYMAGMDYQSPVYSHRMVYIPNVYNELEDVQERAKDQVARLIAQIDTITNAPESRIRRFVTEWFAEFDRLPEASEFLSQRLASDVRWVMPEGEFLGHQGFRDWYAIARGIFKPGCDHAVEQLEVKPKGDGYQVNLHVRLKAETWGNSDKRGEPVNLSVNETWQVEVSERGEILIKEYLVMPVV